MPSIKVVFHAFYLVGIALQLVCAVLLLRRKLQKEYPFFVSYLLVRGISGIFANYMWYRAGSTPSYFFVYWVQTAVVDMGAFAVFYELFCAAFKPFPGLQDMAKIVFRWAALALVLIGVTVFFSSTLPNAQKVQYMVVNLERSLCVMQCALLIFLLMGSSYLGLSKRSPVFGLSFGFGLASTVTLLQLSLVSMLGRDFVRGSFANFAPGLTAILVPAMWCWYIANPERAHETINVPVTSPLLRWNEVALALGHSGGRVAFMDRPEPFMPNVERMVEEVMKRDMFVDHH